MQSLKKADIIRIRSKKNNNDDKCAKMGQVKTQTNAILSRPNDILMKRPF